MANVLGMAASEFFETLWGHSSGPARCTFCGTFCASKKFPAGGKPSLEAKKTNLKEKKQKTRPEGKKKAPKKNRHPLKKSLYTLSRESRKSRKTPPGRF
jgi:ribosomal protein S27E